MRSNKLGVAAVVLIALGIVGYKRMVRATAVERPAVGQGLERLQSAHPRVVLLADLREGDAECGCGDVIRAVRGAAERGVPARAIDMREGAVAPPPYKALVVPTVILLDEQGRETQRFEGETSETVKAMQAQLESLAGKGP